jgi:hypothetical protein
VPIEPLKVDPESTVLVWLAAHDATPEAERPAFEFRFPTARKLREVWRLEDAAQEAAKAEDPGAYIDHIKAALLIGLRGYRNVPGAPKPEDVDDLLRPQEMRELLDRWQAATRLGAAEKKSLPLSPTAGGSSVGAAVTESASTPPASTGPLSSDPSAQAATAIG